MSDIKVGDTIRITAVTPFDEGVVEVGELLKVVDSNPRGVCVTTREGFEAHMVFGQIELVLKAGYTFSEIVAMLINEKLDVETVLTRENKEFIVGRSRGGLGLSPKYVDDRIVEIVLGAIDINGIWTIKEPEKPEPTKYMTVADIEKELGYSVSVIKG